MDGQILNLKKSCVNIMMNEESRGRPVYGWSSQTMVGSPYRIGKGEPKSKKPKCSYVM